MIIDVVSDDDIFLRLMRLMINKVRINVTCRTFNNPYKYIQQFERKSAKYPRILLLDFEMQIISGLKTLNIIEAQLDHLGATKVPFPVALSTFYLPPGQSCYNNTNLIKHSCPIIFKRQGASIPFCKYTSIKACFAKPLTIGMLEKILLITGSQASEAFKNFSG